MSSKAVHYAAGVTLAGGIVLLTHERAGMPLAMLAAIGAIAGSSAPDWLEISGWLFGRRMSLIPHRTITHWLAAWVGFCAWAIWHAFAEMSPEWFFAAGFALSGLTHVLLDAGTPAGVPFFWPLRRKSPRGG